MLWLHADGGAQGSSSDLRWQMTHDVKKPIAAYQSVGHELTRLIARNGDLHSLLEASITAVRSVVDFERATVAVLDRGEPVYRLQLLVETREQAPPLPDGAYPLEQDLFGTVIHDHQWRLLSG